MNALQAAVERGNESVVQYFLIVALMSTLEKGDTKQLYKLLVMAESNLWYNYFLGRAPVLML
jgi:hypothetical protein